MLTALLIVHLHLFEHFNANIFTTAWTSGMNNVKTNWSTYSKCEASSPFFTVCILAYKGRLYHICTILYSACIDSYFLSHRHWTYNVHTFLTSLVWCVTVFTINQAVLVMVTLKGVHSNSNVQWQRDLVIFS